MKKHVILFAITLCLCLLLSACGPTYEDTNGAENFTLQTITDGNIIQLETGASGLRYSESKVGLLHSSSYSSKDFNGVEQIYLANLLGKSDVYIYIGHMNVQKGNFKLVAINNDKIIHEFAPDTFNEEFIFEDLNGTFSIHVAGESAAFDFHIEIH